ncbi:hypothetical protein GXW82_31810 [Streptacidiphilus sp. 4-A2]|nr:hypothetical protein [Streptacidiphilus sp. 4-A2]
MEHIGLYYPYFRVRDDTWLKAAALFWPRMARVVPPQYRPADSLTARCLRDDLNFFIDIDPGRQAELTAANFIQLLQAQGSALQSRYSLTTEQREQLRWSQDHSGAITRRQVTERLTSASLAWLHMDQTDEAGELVALASSLNLAISARDSYNDGRWIGMSPKLVAVYSCALAGGLAAANSLHTITDTPDMLPVSGGFDMDALSRVLLSRRRAAPRADISNLYAFAALRTVVPSGLANVPVSKIIEIRQALEPELDAFQEHMWTINDELADLGQVEDASILDHQLKALVEKNLITPMADLESGFRKLGVKTARAMLSIRSVELPLVAGMAIHDLHLPSVVGAGGAIATQVIGAAAGAKREHSQDQRSGAGYLLGLRNRLDPPGLLNRMQRTLGRSH